MTHLAWQHSPDFQASRSSNAPGVLTTATVQGGATGRSNESTHIAIPEILPMGRNNPCFFLGGGGGSKEVDVCYFDPIV